MINGWLVIRYIIILVLTNKQYCVDNGTRSSDFTELSVPTSTRLYNRVVVETNTLTRGIILRINLRYHVIILRISLDHLDIFSYI